MDVGASYAFTSLKITNRYDCCYDRMPTFELWAGDNADSYNAAGNSMCSDGEQSQTATAGIEEDFACSGKGRYVFIVNTAPGQDVINVAEIKVFGYPEVTDAKYSYMGCYLDADSRTLSVKLADSNTVTTDSCRQTCAGYEYFGLELATECWCGNSLARNDLAYNCDMAAAAAPAESGGGTWALNVYHNHGTSAPTAAPTAAPAYNNAALGFDAGSSEGASLSASTWGVLGDDVFMCTDGLCTKSTLANGRGQWDIVLPSSLDVDNISWEQASFSTSDGSWTADATGLTGTFAGIVVFTPFACSCGAA
jgi:hypothetical protein